ncbi:MAG: hypothetical protein R6X02_28335 [Enhygromyxa sp.]
MSGSSRTTLGCALLAALLLAGCKSDNIDEAKQAKQAPSEAKSDADAAEAKADEAKADAPKPDLADGTLVTPYIELQERLAADRSEGLREAAAALEQAAGSKSEAPGVDELRAAAGRIADGDIEPARAAFREVSDALLRYLDQDAGAREGLTLVYCPMAFDNTGGYWLQRDDKVRNPYEGSRMLSCGSVLAWDEGVAHRERRAQQ